MQPVEVKKKKRLALILAILGASLLLLYLVYTLFVEGYFLFRQEEKKFQEAAEYYYFQYPSRLPKKEGEMTSVTLKELNDLERIEKLMIPKENDICSLDSWVRVFKEGEEYRYYTYLSCGKYQSNVDHEGPTITLNGDNPYYVTVGGEYQDPGIEKVFDDVDQELPVEEVLSDTSNVNTKKIGSYTVRYTAYDKMHNRSDVTREVQVIRNIKDEVIAQTDSSNIYKGANASNYLLFSGMLWRIVKVNEDGTLKLILDDNAANLIYRQDGESFEQSNIAHWLNDYFYSLLHNADTYISQQSTWCESPLENLSKINQTCETYSNGLPVGLLSVKEFLDTYDSNNRTYFSVNTSFWLLDHKNEESGYLFYPSSKERVIMRDNQELGGVRPVINLKTENSFVIDGNGTASDPYKLNDYTYGKDNDKLSDRYIGEYLNYSGQYFRIIGFDEEKNIKVISAGTIKNSTTALELKAGYDKMDEILLFDPTKEGNLGYKLNYEIGNYLNDDLLIEHEFTRSYFDDTKKYNECTTDTFHATFAIPNSYDLFSGVNSNNMLIGTNYYLMDVVNQNGYFLMTNTTNGHTFNVLGEIFPLNSFKIVAFINKDARLAGGKGTFWDPYFIKQ